MTIEIQSQAPETKAGIASSDTVVTHDEMMRVFEAFKAENDERLAASQAGRPDVLSEEKVARIEQRLDELSLKSSRPALAAENKSATSFSAREHKSAFINYMRRGETAGLRQLETKALSVGSNPDGGYTVPRTLQTHCKIEAHHALASQSRCAN